MLNFIFYLIFGGCFHFFFDLNLRFHLFNLLHLICLLICLLFLLYLLNFLFFLGALLYILLFIRLLTLFGHKFFGVLLLEFLLECGEFLGLSGRVVKVAFGTLITVALHVVIAGLSIFS
jgi:hypothetical protein